MKKIAIVIARLGMPGGAEKVAADLAEEFHRHNHEVTIILFDYLAPQQQSYPVSCRIIHLHLPGREGSIFTRIGILLKRAWLLNGLSRREKFDHIFSFLEAANVPCALASRKSVLSIHSNPNNMTRSEWFIFRWLYPRAKRVIAVSQQMQHLLEDRARLRNVSCIYNPINTDLIRIKAQEPITIHSPFILAVGRLEKAKRFDLLLEAFALTKTKDKCKLVILGSGSLHEFLLAKINELNLEQDVILAGFEANPYKYMAKAEFQVMSSDYEGYPLVLVEALSLGCTIVSTNCPTGPGEIIQHGHNGLLVETGNVQAIADGIDQLFFDQDLRNNLRQQAAVSVQNNDIAAVANAWLTA